MNTEWIGANENNFTKGRGGKNIKKIVLHWIVGTLPSADATFANPDREASAHYGISNHTIHQWVKEEDTAWHASNWSVNQESIGIEHEGGWLLDDGTRKVPTDTTHQTSAKLIADICTRHNLPIDRNTIHVHNEYSNTQCPGSLDADKIIELARGFANQAPDPEIITSPQAKLEMGEGWGVMELQKVRSTVNDQRATIKALESEQIKLEENWQKELETAKTKIEILDKQLEGEKIDLVRNMSFWDFMTIKFTRGGDPND